jgi:hypothetical protein
MGLEDLIIKKKVKQYIYNLLTKWLKEARPEEINTPDKIAIFLCDKIEKIFEENFLK